jgi:hypothetical protein
VSTEAERQRALTDARAKLVWGQSADDVRKMLLAQGFDAAEVETLIRQVRNDTLQDDRLHGLKLMVVSVPLMAVSVYGFYVWPDGGSGWAGAVIGAPGFLGFYLLVKGYSYMLPSWRDR